MQGYHPPPPSATVGAHQEPPPTRSYRVAIGRARAEMAAQAHAAAESTERHLVAFAATVLALAEGAPPATEAEQYSLLYRAAALRQGRTPWSSELLKLRHVSRALWAIEQELRALGIDPFTPAGIRAARRGLVS